MQKLREYLDSLFDPVPINIFDQNLSVQVPSKVNQSTLMLQANESETELSVIQEFSGDENSTISISSNSNSFSVQSFSSKPANAELEVVDVKPQILPPASNLPRPRLIIRPIQSSVQDSSSVQKQAQLQQNTSMSSNQTPLTVNHSPIVIQQTYQLKPYFLSTADLKKFSLIPDSKQAQPSKYYFCDKHEYIISDKISKQQLIDIQKSIYMRVRAVDQISELSISKFRKALIDQACADLKIKSLRKHQLIALNNIMQNKHQLLSIATSGGKSLIYTLPTVIMSKITFIITPTIALRNDQVSQLNSLGVFSYQLCSEGTNSIQPYELEIIEKKSLVFVTPEKLQQKSTVEAIKRLIFKREICLFAIDECHLMMDWQDFREDFNKIPYVLKQLCDTEFDANLKPSVVALTATISHDGIQQLQNLFNQSGFQLETCIFDVYRENLIINVVNTKLTNEQKQQEIKSILMKDANKYQSNNLLKIKSFRPPKTIVYCRSKQKNEDMKDFLMGQHISCTIYHSQVKQQQQNIDDFTLGRCPVITATIGFGMGVNIPDVRQVISADLPGSVNEFLQKIGRAGRDQQEANAYQLFSQSEIKFVLNLIIGDKQIDQKRKTQQIFQLITVSQLLMRNCCYWAQMQQFFCGFNVHSCGKCSACKQNSELALISIQELLQAIISSLRQKQIKYTDIGKSLKDDIEINYNNLEPSEIVSLVKKFGQEYREQFTYYLVHELILSGNVIVNHLGSIDVAFEIDEKLAWLVI
ncbi:ATP-dependent_DNA helicase RecQ [Hexamita inflata]|uniref:DNA 3'-5' helicase n=1 Tax=Hexamita inflata TaxID=28002 RepID=A0ABP1HJZ1_9EUKA